MIRLVSQTCSMGPLVTVVLVLSSVLMVTDAVVVPAQKQAMLQLVQSVMPTYYASKSAAMIQEDPCASNKVAWPFGITCDFAKTVIR